MKTVITPEIITAFNEKNLPALCSIGCKNICFNKQAQRLLALKTDSQFLLEHEDDKLYYKDSSAGFKLTTSGKNVLMINISGIGKYVENILKKGKKTYRFQIGELIEGRRELITFE